MNPPAQALNNFIGSTTPDVLARIFVTRLLTVAEFIVLLHCALAAAQVL